VAAFIPLLFMTGLIGRVFREFSVTLAFAIAVSTVVSLSVTPMICAHFLRKPPSADATWLDRLVERILRVMVRFYGKSLAVVLDHRALTLLVISKNPVASQNAQIALTNFVPWTTATVKSYGLAQDYAAETNGPAVLQNIATNSVTVASTFNYNFPPLSLTLFTFSPGPSALSVLTVQPTSVQLQLQGQSGAPYVIQSATNLPGGIWTSIATNVLNGATTNITVSVAPGASKQFYRSVWQP
jgi:hypothetical protein